MKRCAFGLLCGRAVYRRGGMDEHHAWPKSWGGPDDGKLILLCPNHHRRQHSLLHFWAHYASLMPQDVPKLPAAIGKLFTAAEIATAQYALTNWLRIGSPPIKGEPAAMAG